MHITPDSFPHSIVLTHAWQLSCSNACAFSIRYDSLPPELFDVGENEKTSVAKSLLDALYEEGIVPTYSFPKNVVSTYITDTNGKLIYEVDRGLDVAIGEYAPGRAIVVDKQTYQIGGIFYPGSERRRRLPVRPLKAVSSVSSSHP